MKVSKLNRVFQTIDRYNIFLLILGNVGEELGDSVEVLVLPVHVQEDVLSGLLDCTLAACSAQNNS